MNQHRNTKTIQQYKDTKQRLQKETRRAYWNYLENIIIYHFGWNKFIHDVMNFLLKVFP
jgi:hypothetical protein